MVKSAMFIAAALLSVTKCAFAVESTVQVGLRPHVQAEGTEWVLGDALDVPASLRASMGLDDLRLKAPHPGQIDRWRPGQLERFIRARARRTLPEFSWTGAAQLLVTRKVQVVAGDELVKAATAAWAANVGIGVVGAIEPMRTVDPIEVPLGSYRLRARHIDRPEQGQVVVWVDVLIDDRVVRSASVALRNQTRQVVFLANRPLAPGEQVSASDFTRTEAVGIERGHVAVPEVRTIRLRRALRQGDVLTTTAIETTGTVRRGETVQVIVRERALTLEVNGTATEDALPGQMIAVHWGQGHDLVRGRLLDNHKVEIQ